MNKSYLYVCLSIAISLFCLYVSLINGQTIELNLGLGKMNAPMSVALIIAWALGVLSLYCYKQKQKLVAKTSQTQLEWKAQDAKLMASIASDKEKQLEAKIATLEAALKTALKKND